MITFPLDGYSLAACRRGFTPPPKLTVSEWADRYRELSPEVSPERGRWKTSRTPYLREIMDVMGDDEHEDVCCMTGTQIGKTSALENLIGYVMQSDPSPMLVVFPRDKDVKTFSKERITPMLRDTKVLRGLVKQSERRSSDDTLERKVFPGGYVALASSRSPADLAARPVRRVLGDEVDRWPTNTGKEGSPWELVGKRTTNFWNRKKIAVSTPTEQDLSLIEWLWNESDQRHYHLTCPHCQHEQPLRWRDDAGQYHLICDKDEHGQLLPETAQYRCAECAALIPESSKSSMLKAGRWIATHPERRKVGFHLNALYSPWVSWSQVVAAFAAAKGSKEKLQTFVNTWLGLPFAVEYDKVEPSSLQARSEDAADLWPHVRMLTAGLDVQADRVEVLIVGWGERERSFFLEWEQVYGDPQAAATWEQVDAVLWRERNGMKVRLAAVDTGYLSPSVHRWAALDYNRRRVIPIKGMPGRGRLVVAKPAAATTKKERRPWLVGVETASDMLFARLRSAVPSHGSLQFCNTLPVEFYDQLTSEVSVPIVVNGRHERQTRVLANRRNEVPDMWRYATAALYALGARGVASLNVAPPPAPVPAADESVAPPPPVRRAPVRRGGWVNGWKS